MTDPQPAAPPTPVSMAVAVSERAHRGRRSCIVSFQFVRSLTRVVRGPVLSELFVCHMSRLTFLFPPPPRAAEMHKDCASPSLGANVQRFCGCPLRARQLQNQNSLLYFSSHSYFASLLGIRGVKPAGWKKTLAQQPCWEQLVEEQGLATPPPGGSPLA